eukprot:Platyproteum_vivax@DN12249_c0_g1_i1.p1
MMGSGVMGRGTALDRIIQEKEREVKLLRQRVYEDPLGMVVRESDATTTNIHQVYQRRGYNIKKRPFENALASDKMSVIAEIKRRSPSAGSIHNIDSIAAIVRAYTEHHTSCISVLTDEKFFGGSLDDLKEVIDNLVALRCREKVPVLRKDFIIDPLQIAESIVAGADCVLLIAGILQDGLPFMIRECNRMGVECLVEVHDEEELFKSLECRPRILGINTCPPTSP